jgi:hypothetical protein
MEEPADLTVTSSREERFSPMLITPAEDSIARWLSVDSTECSDEEELLDQNSVKELAQWLGVNCLSA